MTKIDEQIKKVAKLKRKPLKEGHYGFHSEELPQPGSGAEGLRKLQRVYNKHYKLIKKAFTNLIIDVEDNLSDTDYWEEGLDWSKDIDKSFE